MTCTTFADGLTICTSGPTIVLAEEVEDDERWCFGCRKRVRYLLTLEGSREPSHYEPTWSARCPNGCGDRASGGFWYVHWNGGDEA